MKADFCVYDKKGKEVLKTSDILCKSIGTFITKATEGSFTDKRLLEGEPWAIPLTAMLAGPFQVAMGIDISIHDDTIKYRLKTDNFIDWRGIYTDFSLAMTKTGAYIIMYGIK